MDRMSPTSSWGSGSDLLLGEPPGTSRSPQARKPLPVGSRPLRRGWGLLTGTLLVGYLLMSRSFAYLGIPPLRLFISEATLAAFLVLTPSVSIRRWANSLVNKTELNPISWAIYAALVYGLLQVVRGTFAGYSLIASLQIYAFNLYPFFLFLGIWVGENKPDLLRRALLTLVWANGIYGVLYVAYLGHVEIVLPGTAGLADTFPVKMFGQPAGSAISILALLCFDRRLQRYWVPLGLNTAVLLALAVRAEWVGLLLALLVWGVLQKQFKRVMIAVASVTLFLAIAYLANFSFPGPRGEISSQETVGRVLAPFDSDLASQYSANASVYAGTTEWRTRWWARIWDNVHQDSLRALLGNGYGFPLRSLVLDVSSEVRSPHNVFFYALGYGGWMGLALFLWLTLGIARLLWKSYRRNHQPFGILFFSMALVFASLSNFLETPFGAIPFYIVLGLSIGAARVFDPEDKTDRQRGRGRYFLVALNS